MRVREARTLRRVMALRLGSHLPSADITFRELFRTGIFTLLDEGETWSISGAAGRIWSPSGPYARLGSAADYRRYREPGTAKVAFLNEVVEHPRGAQIVSEARVWCVDRRAWLRFIPLWSIVAPFERFVGGEALRIAARRAEGR